MPSSTGPAPTALVAGGSGLLGANLTRRLVEARWDVLASYRRTPPPADLAACYRPYDFTRFEDCLEATRGRRYVFLGAAERFGSQMMAAQPAAAVLPNLQVGAGLLEACSRNKVEKVVLVSTATVYQEAGHSIAEHELDLNQAPFPLYEGVAWVFRYLEQLARFYVNRSDMAVTVVRATNIYGPHDHFDPERSNVLPALIRRALRHEVPFQVWGDGSAVRDFIFVDDFIDDLLELVEIEGRADPVNLGHGQGTSIRRAVEATLKVCNHSVEPVYDVAAPAAIPRRLVSIARLERLLGPRHRTPLEEGLRRTADWYTSSTDAARDRA